MSIMTNYSSPTNRCFASELKELDLDQILERKKDIDTYIDNGVYSTWMVVTDLKDTIFKYEYWNDYDIVRYNRLLNMELFDRCTKCELYPELKFIF